MVYTQLNDLHESQTLPATNMSKFTPLVSPRNSLNVNHLHICLCVLCVSVLWDGNVMVKEGCMGQLSFTASIYIHVDKTSSHSQTYSEDKKLNFKRTTYQNVSNRMQSSWALPRAKTGMRTWKQEEKRKTGTPRKKDLRKSFSGHHLKGKKTNYTVNWLCQLPSPLFL